LQSRLIFVQIIKVCRIFELSNLRVSQILGARKGVFYPGWDCLKKLSVKIYSLKETGYIEVAKVFLKHLSLSIRLLEIRQWYRFKQAMRSQYRRHYWSLNTFANRCPCRTCLRIRHARLVYTVATNDTSECLPADVPKRYGRLGNNRRGFT